MHYFRYSFCFTLKLLFVEIFDIIKVYKLAFKLCLTLSQICMYCTRVIFNSIFMSHCLYIACSNLVSSHCIYLTVKLENIRTSIQVKDVLLFPSEETQSFILSVLFKMIQYEYAEVAQQSYAFLTIRNHSQPIGIVHRKATILFQSVFPSLAFSLMALIA